ncbi:hypothetical protein F4777DRAFT_426967 [Nemania sp. FL0916]|nr:hypothetical protein F4777DRAFT_426967 [Nemania sp. FL0916]
MAQSNTAQHSMASRIRYLVIPIEHIILVWAGKLEDELFFLYSISFRCLATEGGHLAIALFTYTPIVKCLQVGTYYVFTMHTTYYIVLDLQT